MIEDIRIANLNVLITEHGGQRQLSEVIGKAPAQISQWINRAPNSATGKPRALKSDTAREIERRTDKPVGWLDQDHATPSVVPRAARRGAVRVDQLAVDGGMGDERIDSEHPDVISTVYFTEPYIRALIGFVPEAGRLKLVTGRGPSMIPAIMPGDVVLVDTGVRQFDGDGFYMIDCGTGQQIKALQARGDGIHVVSANDLFQAFRTTESTVVCGRVYLRHHLERLA